MTKQRYPGRAWSVWATSVLLVLSCVQVAGAVDHEQQAAESARFFSADEIVHLRLRLSDEAAEALRTDPRTYVSATLIENDSQIYENIAVRLKGSYGSFQGFDERPALTLNMDKFQPDGVFHGLDKFHLNNSVQDESLLHERIGSEIFRAAGIPAPRVTHARVWLDDRDLGVYVLKEGFDRRFLARNFTDASGNLYDGGLLQEIDAGLERDEGEQGESGADLLALAEACRRENLEERYAAIESHLDVEWFVTFMALEKMTQHWDGYCQSCNNYRVYFDPAADGKARFLPHGMDQLFGDSTGQILDFPPALVASSVMQHAPWRVRYRERIKELLPLFEPQGRLDAVIREVQQRLQPVKAAIDEEAAQAYDERVRELRERLEARYAFLVTESEGAEPGALEFDEQGRHFLEGWISRSDSEDALLEEREAVEEEDIPRRFVIGVAEGEATVASWRKLVWLPPGRYQFEARVRTYEVVDSIDEQGRGAGIRISGASRKNHVESNRVWKTLIFQFETEQFQPVELVAELRAAAGRVWFDADSLFLVRLE